MIISQHFLLSFIVLLWIGLLTFSLWHLCGHQQFCGIFLSLLFSLLAIRLFYFTVSKLSINLACLIWNSSVDGQYFCWLHSARTYFIVPFVTLKVLFVHILVVKSWFSSSSLPLNFELCDVVKLPSCLFGFCCVGRHQHHELLVALIAGTKEDPCPAPTQHFLLLVPIHPRQPLTPTLASSVPSVRQSLQFCLKISLDSMTSNPRPLYGRCRLALQSNRELYPLYGREQPCSRPTTSRTIWPWKIKKNLHGWLNEQAINHQKLS